MTKYFFLLNQIERKIKKYKHNFLTYLLQYRCQSPGLVNVEYIGMGIEVATANIHTVAIIIFACL